MAWPAIARRRDHGRHAKLIPGGRLVPLGAIRLGRGRNSVECLSGGTHEGVRAISLPALHTREPSTSA